MRHPSERNVARNVRDRRTRNTRSATIRIVPRSPPLTLLAYATIGRSAHAIAALAPARLRV